MGDCMTSAPKRKTPTPAEVRKAREKAGLTQKEAGALIGATLRAWQYWEAGDRKMDPAKWELWQIKVGQK